MISLDSIFLEIVKENMITISVALLFLKGLADISPWKWDNKIVELLESMLNGIRRKKPNGGVK